MKYFFFFFIISSAVAASTTPMDHKKGFVMGVGLNAGIYKFPIQFEGETKKEIDDTATIIGPSGHFGYDFVLWNRLLLGVRAEGMLADTSGMNKDKTSRIYDHTKGKSRAVNGSLRMGYVREFMGSSPVGDSYPMVYEIFVEGGMGSGKNTFTLNYEYNGGGVSEAYKESISETFNSRVVSAGFNLTSQSGAFFEFKVMRTIFDSNRVKREGSFTVNGGAATSIDETLKNTDPDALTSFFVTLGHHY